MNPEEVYKAQVDGTMDSDIRDHMPRLRQLSKGNVFEIGVRHGISTAALLCGVKDNHGHVWSADVNDWCEKLYADDPNWTFINAHSVNDCQRILGMLPRPLDLLFIDSDHKFDSTIHELRTYGPLVRKDGGAILMHDTELVGVGVKAALELYAKEIGKTPAYATGSYGLGELFP
jgi:predicted O-methyltransferase YrrM